MNCEWKKKIDLSNSTRDIDIHTKYVRIYTMCMFKFRWCQIIINGLNWTGFGFDWNGICLSHIKSIHESFSLNFIYGSLKFCFMILAFRMFDAQCSLNHFMVIVIQSERHRFHLIKKWNESCFFWRKNVIKSNFIQLCPAPFHMVMQSLFLLRSNLLHIIIRFDNPLWLNSSTKNKPIKEWTPWTEHWTW